MQNESLSRKSVKKNPFEEQEAKKMAELQAEMKKKMKKGQKMSEILMEDDDIRAKAQKRGSIVLQKASENSDTNSTTDSMDIKALMRKKIFDTIAKTKAQNEDAEKEKITNNEDTLNTSQLSTKSGNDKSKSLKKQSKSSTFVTKETKELMRKAILDKAKARNETHSADEAAGGAAVDLKEMMKMKIFEKINATKEATAKAKAEMEEKAMRDKELNEQASDEVKNNDEGSQNPKEVNNQEAVIETNDNDIVNKKSLNKNEEKFNRLIKRDNKRESILEKYSLNIPTKSKRENRDSQMFKVPNFMLVPKRSLTPRLIDKTKVNKTSQSVMGPTKSQVSSTTQGIDDKPMGSTKATVKKIDTNSNLLMTTKAFRESTKPVQKIDQSKSMRSQTKSTTPINTPRSFKGASSTKIPLLNVKSKINSGLSKSVTPRLDNNSNKNQSSKSKSTQELPKSKQKVAVKKCSFINEKVNTHNMTSEFRLSNKFKENSPKKAQVRIEKKISLETLDLSNDFNSDKNNNKSSLLMQNLMNDDTQELNLQIKIITDDIATKDDQIKTLTDENASKDDQIKALLEENHRLTNSLKQQKEILKKLNIADEILSDVDAYNKIAKAEELPDGIEELNLDIKEDKIEPDQLYKSINEIIQSNLEQFDSTNYQDYYTMDLQQDYNMFFNLQGQSKTSDSINNFIYKFDEKGFSITYLDMDNQENSDLASYKGASVQKNTQIMIIGGIKGNKTISDKIYTLDLCIDTQEFKLTKCTQYIPIFNQSAIWMADGDVQVFGGQQSIESNECYDKDTIIKFNMITGGQEETAYTLTPRIKPLLYKISKTRFLVGLGYTKSSSHEFIQLNDIKIVDIESNVMTDLSSSNQIQIDCLNQDIKVENDNKLIIFGLKDKKKALITFDKMDETECSIKVDEQYYSSKIYQKVNNHVYSISEGKVNDENLEQ